MPIRTFVSLCLCVAGWHGAGLAVAGDVPAGAGYRVVSSTLDGGTPQTSSHAASGYRVSGTVGQPDAARSSAAGFVLDGGFWPASRGEKTTQLFSDGFETPPPASVP